MFPSTEQARTQIAAASQGYAKRKVLQFCKDHSVEVDDIGNNAQETNVTLWSPAGEEWVATGCHTLSIHYFTHPGDAWEELLKDVKLGLAFCEDPDCENCYV